VRVWLRTQRVDAISRSNYREADVAYEVPDDELLNGNRRALMWDLNRSQFARF